MKPAIRTALAFTAAALLAGCGGSQLPISAPGAMPHSRASSGYQTLYNFGAGHDGAAPKAGLIELNGTLYGTTYAGGKHGYGTVFSVGTTGSEKVLYSFQASNDGANPSASLIAVKDVLYGTTEYGGPHLDGTIFKIKASGIEKVLYSFQGHYYGYDGAHPVASLIDVKGTLYGTTSNGGSNSECQYSCGTVYSVSRTGKENVLHSFQLYTDGALPLGSLIDVKGTLYGTTQAGGAVSFYGPGTIFSISRAGTEKVLYNFQYHGLSGAAPLAGLTNVKGTLYGTTGYGAVYGYGTAFSITTSGNLTLLHTFGDGSDGSRPAASLLNVHGTLYGTTELGGTYGKGTIFKTSLTGKEKVLHSFGYGTDGATPLAGLIDVNGTLYGTTSAGGTSGNGTVFALTLR